jgi:alanine racemase
LRVAGSRDQQPVAWIDRTALAGNFREAERLAGGREVIAVVKADAYGHGSIAVSRCLAAAGCGRFAVLDVGEASALREAGIDAPILLLAGVGGAEDATAAAELGLTPVVHHAEALPLLEAAARAAGCVIPVHVEVDTGMHRMGVASDEAVRLMEAVTNAAALALEGAFTHFACADEADPDDSIAQLRTFAEVLARAAQRGLRPSVIHADNSAGLLTGKVLAEALPAATAVRPGLMLYGVRPAPHLDPDRRLRPVMSVRAPVVQVRDVAAGASVGYGATYRAERPTRLATLRFGYADGFPCAAGGGGQVWLGGACRPVVGRVSMDYIAVDLGDAGVEIGDEAVIFGTVAQGGEVGISVEEAAAACGTIAYELLVRVGSRVARVEVD